MTFVQGIPDFVVLAKQNADPDVLPLPGWLDYASSQYDPNWMNRNTCAYASGPAMPNAPIYIALNGCRTRIEPIFTFEGLARALQDNGIIVTHATYLASKGL